MTKRVSPVTESPSWCPGFPATTSTDSGTGGVPIRALISAPGPKKTESLRTRHKELD